MSQIPHLVPAVRIDGMLHIYIYIAGALVTIKYFVQIDKKVCFTCLSIGEYTGIITLKGIFQQILTKGFKYFFLAAVFVFIIRIQGPKTVIKSEVFMILPAVINKL